MSVRASQTSSARFCGSSRTAPTRVQTCSTNPVQAGGLPKRSRAHRSTSRKSSMAKILGIITARGGSKGIPGKNIKPLLGKPLIVYTIEAAKESRALDRIILSTDDVNIADVAKRYGCEVPFLRPRELAQDTTQHLPVLQHAVRWLKNNEGYSPDYIMTLQPTSPLRQPFHIKEAVDLILKTEADSVLSVAEIPEHFTPHKAMIADADGMLKLMSGNPVRTRTNRRQDLGAAYWSVGAIYLFKTELMFHPTDPNCYGDRVAPYVMKDKYIVDIDAPADWEVAERALDKIKGEI